jgi:hypothetical protein
MDPTTAPLIAAVASSITAVTALGGFGFAVWKAGRELDRWRREKREVKHAEVAGEVLVTTLRFLTTLENATSILMPANGIDNDTDVVFRTEVARRCKMIDDVTDEFIKAWQLAETYLPDNINELLVRVWDERGTIVSSQQVYSGLPRGSREGQFADMYKDGFGPTAKNRVVTLRAEARETLRPLAQLTDGAVGAKDLPKRGPKKK